MARLIDADALEEAIRTDYWEHFTQCHDTDQIALIDMVCEDIGNAPTVDAKPVVHGRWITHNKGQNNWCECSECNTVGSPFWKCCPVCEAKMDGDGNA